MSQLPDHTYTAAETAGMKAAALAEIEEVMDRYKNLGRDLIHRVAMSDWQFEQVVKMTQQHKFLEGDPNRSMSFQEVCGMPVDTWHDLLERRQVLTRLYLHTDPHHFGVALTPGESLFSGEALLRGDEGIMWFGGDLDGKFTRLPKKPLQCYEVSQVKVDNGRKQVQWQVGVLWRHSMLYLRWLCDFLRDSGYDGATRVVTISGGLEASCDIARDEEGRVPCSSAELGRKPEKQT